MRTPVQSGPANTCANTVPRGSRQHGALHRGRKRKGFGSWALRTKHSGRNAAIRNANASKRKRSDSKRETQTQAKRSKRRTTKMPLACVSCCVRVLCAFPKNARAGLPQGRRLAEFERFPAFPVSFAFASTFAQCSMWRGAKRMGGPREFAGANQVQACLRSRQAWMGAKPASQAHARHTRSETQARANAKDGCEAHQVQTCLRARNSKMSAGARSQTHARHTRSKRQLAQAKIWRSICQGARGTLGPNVLAINAKEDWA
jgi:hypothetical protein